VVAGPKIDFLAGETEALKTFLGKSGKVLLEIDPTIKADDKPLTNLLALAHDWGFDLGNDVVVDASGMGRLIGTGADVPLAATYPQHPITDRFEVLTAYPLARSVAPVTGGVNGHNPQVIVESSPRSWAETNLKELADGKPVAQDPKADKPGPVGLAAAVSAVPTADPAKPEDANAPKPETRMVVFGDSDFARNSYLGIQGNKDLFMNTIGWLSQQENLISIRPKEADDRRLTMTAAQQTNIDFLVMLGLPLLIIGMGIYTWARRR